MQTDHPLRCRILPQALRFAVAPGQTILDAALAAGMSVPFSCQRGACGSCLVDVLEGEHGRASPATPDSFAVGPGQLLMCQSHARTPLSLRIPNWTPDRPVARRHTVTIDSKTALPGDVIRLVLVPGSGACLPSLPGQHVRVHWSDTDHRCFSIANLRREDEPIELHIRTVPGGAFSERVLSTLAVGDTLTIEGPFGHCVWESAEPGIDHLVLLATGTGYAGVSAILHAALASAAFATVTIYWAGRAAGDHYGAEALDELARAHPALRWIALVPGRSKSHAGMGALRSTHVQDLALAAAHDWSRTMVYACGHPAMVRDARAALSDAGLAADRFRSESFVASGAQVHAATPAVHAWEKVGQRFERRGIVEARRRSIEAVQEIGALLRPGMTTQDAIELADRRLREMGSSHTWHPTYVRFGPDTQCAWNQPADRGRRLRESDIFFVDIGPVWDGYEGDYGDTFVLGDDPAHARCAMAARAIFDEVRAHWEGGVTGRELYAHADRLAAARGYELVHDVAGHRISDFPHALYGKQRLANADFPPEDGIWVLEIQVREPERRIGAFFEDVLLRE